MSRVAAPKARRGTASKARTDAAARARKRTAPTARKRTAATARKRTAPKRTAAARRGRLLLAASALFALVVMLTGMPVSALLTQRHQLATTAAELTQLQGTDRTLTAQARALTDSSTMSALARSEYGLVPSGQKAYIVLPPSGSTAAQVAGSGHVPLEGPPVAPGSAQSEALLGLSGAVSSTTTPAPRATGAVHAGTRASRPSSFWGRVLRTLEFWR